MMARGKVVLVTVVIAVAATGGIGWWRHEQQAARVRASLRTTPALAAASPELRVKFADAQRSVREGKLSGLAELSRLYHANGFLNEAAECYDALARLQPGEPRWLHRHAAILAGYGESEPALARWRRVTELAPDYLPAQLRLGDLLLKQNRAVEADVVYRRVLAREGGNRYAELGLARIDFENERWSQARERLEKVVRATDYTLGYDLIVTVYERLGLQEQAAAVRSRAKASGAHRDPADPWMAELLDFCFDPYQLALAAGAANRNGDSVTAIRWLERAATLAPSDPTIPFQLAAIYSERRDHQRAREQLERGTVIGPEFADGWAHLSALLEQSGDAVGAERVLAEGLTHCPDSPGLHLMRARIHRKAARAADAVAAYRTSIRLRANEAEPHIELATLLLQLDRGAEGIAELHQALAVEPDHPTALTVLALHAISTGDESTARRWLTRVRAQPRVPAPQVQQLMSTYRQQFGRAFE